MLPSEEEERNYRLKKTKELSKKIFKKSKKKLKKTLRNKRVSTTSNNSTRIDVSHQFKSSTSTPNEISEVKKVSSENQADKDPIGLQSGAMTIDFESDKDSYIALENLEESDDGEDSSSTTSEVSFSKRSFYLKLPSVLKYILIYDHDMITYRKALPTVPAHRTVSTIVNDYLSLIRLTKRGRKSLYVDDTFNFLINSFNSLIGTILLYKKEKSQVNYQV